MPEPGYKSITVPETTYNRFYEVWKMVKPEYEPKGINSFSAFLTYKLAEAHKTQKVIPDLRFIPIAFDELAQENIILLKDTWCNELAEVHNNNSNLYCMTCKKEFCLHTGFCYSLPQVYQITKKAR